VTKTCLQCGAVLPSSVRACSFCDSSFSVGPSIWEDASEISAKANLSSNADTSPAQIGQFQRRAVSADQPGQDASWRGELSQRIDAYRARRRTPVPNEAQAQFPFDDHSCKTPRASVAVAGAQASVEEDFSFTIAIGRPSDKSTPEESRMVIDVSLPPGPEAGPQSHGSEDQRKSMPGLHPLASIDDRRLAALVDLFCLLFAYGGFLMLFGSLGGQFTLSKLSAVVYVATFAIVYLQYFALFTTFGGTTPGMMMRGLQVVSFSGEPPTPRQMLLRSAGYMLSAGTFFMGFLWVMWDEDELTWHDRLSRTYLSPVQTLAEFENPGVAPSR